MSKIWPHLSQKVKASSERCLSMNKISKPLKGDIYHQYDEQIYNVQKYFWEHLEEEPDGLAEDEDEDKRQQNKAALGVRRGFSWTNIDINRYDNIKFRFMNFFVYMGMFWQLKFESMRG